MTRSICVRHCAGFDKSFHAFGAHTQFSTLNHSRVCACVCVFLEQHLVSSGYATSTASFVFVENYTVALDPETCVWCSRAFNFQFTIEFDASERARAVRNQF